MTRRASLPAVRPFNDNEKWLEQFRARQAPKPARCCPRCQRGPIPGQFDCGRPGTCPNLDCPHSKGRMG